jgi:hypothetical protein
MDDETRTQSDSFSKTELGIFLTPFFQISAKTMMWKNSDSEVDELESADEEGGGDEAYRANNSASEEKQQHSNNEYLQQTTVQQQQSTAAGILQVELSPIEKLYHMHQTYFTVA